MNLPTSSDKLSLYTDLYDHFSTEWKLHGKQAAKESEFNKQSTLVRQVGLERGIATAIEELIQIYKK